MWRAVPGLNRYEQGCNKGDEDTAHDEQQYDTHYNEGLMYYPDDHYLEVRSTADNDPDPDHDPDGFDTDNIDPAADVEATIDTETSHERDWRWKRHSDPLTTIPILPRFLSVSDTTQLPLQPQSYSRPLPTPQQPSSHTDSFFCPSFNDSNRSYSDNFSNHTSEYIHRYGYDHLRLGRRSPTSSRRLMRMFGEMFLDSDDGRDKR